MVKERTQKIIFATGNSNKVREVQQLLEKHYTIQSLKDLDYYEEVPETSDTIVGNAIQKAEFIYNAFAKACFADDTGLEITSLKGEPGVYSARYAGPEKSAAANIKKVLRQLEGKSDRSAQFKTVIALRHNNGIKTFEGLCKGVIIETTKGTDGFGYDPIFVPNGHSQTFAEMDAKGKNEISHRGIAVRKLVKYLLSEYSL